MSSTLHLSRSDDGRVVQLCFDHGKANEMGTAQLDELDALSDSLEQDGRVAALISFSRKRSSRGTPIFVAGANVTERVGWDDDRVKAHVARQRETLARVRRLPLLHVCVVDGVAFGWGAEWLLTSDYTIAGPDARFSLPETGLGILPGAGGTTELQARIGPAHALRLGMTGETIDAEEALRIGLVQERAATADAGFVRAAALAERAASRSPSGNGAFKAALLNSQGRPASERTALEAAAYAACVDGGDAAIGRAWFASGAVGVPAFPPRNGR